VAHGTPTAPISGGASAATWTSGSHTPTGDALLLAFCIAERGSSTQPTKPTITDTGTLTWTERVDVSYPSGSIRLRITGYEATAPASPASRTYTVASTSAATVNLIIVQITDAKVRLVSGTPNVAYDDDANGDPNCSNWPNALGTNTTVIGAATNQGSGFTEGATYTQLIDTVSTGSTRRAAQYDAGSPANCSWTSSGLISLGVAIEVEDLITGQPYAKRLGGVPFMARNRGVW